MLFTLHLAASRNNNLAIYVLHHSLNLSVLEHEINKHVLV